MKYDKFSRRMFLQGSGKFALAIPVLPSLLPRETWAQAAKPPVRYIAVIGDLGYGRHADWYPTNNVLGQTLNVANHHPIKYASLKSFAPNANSNLSPIFKNHLNRHLGQMLMLRGLDVPAVYGHSKSALMGNLGDGSSTDINVIPEIRTIDMVLNDSTKFNPDRRDAVLMGYTMPMGSAGAQTLSFQRDSSGRVVGRFWDKQPLDMFRLLFPNPSIYNNPTTEEPAALPEKPYVDHLTAAYDDYRRTMNSRNISSADKSVLQSMMDRFSDLQKALTPTTRPATRSGACEATISKVQISTSRSTLADDVRVMKAYVDLMVMAVACDVTRVGLIGSMYDTRRHHITMREFGFSSGNYHANMTHEPYSSTNGRTHMENIRRFNEWHIIQVMKPLLDQLADAQDTDGNSLLHNSLVHFGLESSLVHWGNSVPTVLAGKAGGALNTGWYVDYMDRTKRPHTSGAGGHSSNVNSDKFHYQWPGLLYNRLYPTIFQKLGLSVNDYKHSTDSKYVGTVDGYGYQHVRNNDVVKFYTMAHSGMQLPLPPTNAA